METAFFVRQKYYIISLSQILTSILGNNSSESYLILKKELWKIFI